MKTNGIWLAALLMTACTSDKDVLQSTTEPTPSQAVAQQAVTFDTYLAGATAITRAGDPGVMTTEKLKTANKGFGVFAFYRDKSDGEVDYGAGGYYPNFMYNEHVSWDNGWTYSPLKYWPNATEKDSQDPAAVSQYDTDSEPPTRKSNLAKLSFFAYAPYVSTGAGGTLSTDGDDSEDANNGYWIKDTETSGIIAIHKNTPSNPYVKWAYSPDLDKNVDLLWGVAPAGMAYQSVNPDIYINVPVGMPLKDLVKPDKDQKVKFLFQHALSRIGLSVVSAIDQIAAGDDAGTFSKDPTTKVLIKNVQIWGDFGKTGKLNLNNAKPNEAKWEDVSKSGVADANPLFWFDNGTAIGSLAANGYIAPELRYDASQITAVGISAASFADVNEGVLPSEKAILASGVEDRYAVTGTPAYEFGKSYYKKVSNDYELAYATATLSSANIIYSKDKNDNYVQAAASTTSFDKMDGKTKYYLITATAKNNNEGGSQLTIGKEYWRLEGTTYTHYVREGSDMPDSNNYPYYTIAETEIASGAAGVTSVAYAGGTNYWSNIVPRYFMVIPSGKDPVSEDPIPTTIKVKINYAVVTKDTRLDGNISNIENDITKTVSVNLENGKSYNLKLILGLTSVKLDATVADWKVADETEFFLPQNNE